MPHDAQRNAEDLESTLAAHAATARSLRLYLSIALVIEAIFALYYVARSKAFLFIDIGSDTFFQFYPLQVAVGRQLSSLHEVTWSFDLGLGGYLGTLFDPFWYLTGAFPDSWQSALRLPLFAIKILLAGGFFCGYLRLLGFRARYATLGALAFAFSSYGTIDVQWDVIIGVEFVQFAAYLFLLETYLRGNRAWAAVCAGIVLGLGHPMELYSFALFTVVYALARRAVTADRGGMFSYALSFASFAAWCAAGLLLTAPILLPALYYFFESPRVTGEHSIVQGVLSQVFTINSRATLASEVIGLLGKDMLGTGSLYNGWMNYFEGPGFYIGILLLICIPQLLGPHATRRERMFCIGGMISIAAYFLFPALRFAVYGFGHPGFRFSTLWVSTLLLVMGLTGLRRAADRSPWRGGIALGAAGIAVLAVSSACLLPKITNFEHVTRVLTFVTVYTALLLSGTVQAWRMNRSRALVLIFAAELLLFATPAMIERDAVGADGSSSWGTYNDGSAAAIELVRKLEPGSNFYRIEKTFNSVFLGDALIQDYPGIKSYYHHGSSVTRFVDRLSIPRPVQHANWIGSPVCCHGVLDLVGAKYELARQRSLDGTPGMTYLDTAGGVDIYRNESAHSFGSFYDDVVAETQLDGVPAAERVEFLLHHVVVASPAEIEALLGSPIVPGNNPGLPQPRADLRKLQDNRVEGPVQTPASKVLLISMPFDRGWTALLDNAPLRLFRADFGLTAVVVPAGAHQLQLTYSPPGRLLGFWLSAASAALLVLAAFIVRRRRAQRTTEGTSRPVGLTS